jgi:WD40 repeat protein
MANVLSQAQMIAQFVCGMLQQERKWSAHLLDTKMKFYQWHSHQMVNTSSQAQLIKQFVCGMPQQEKEWGAHLLDTQIGSCLWHFHQMAHHFVSGSADETVRVWNISNEGVMAAGLFTRHTESAEPATFSSDGQFTISSELGSIHMFLQQEIQ